MIRREPYSLPADKRRTLAHAVRLEWWTLFFLVTITVVMYLAMGNSQAMKTAWVEDVLSMVPPILLLIAIRFHDDEPTARHPYGKRRLVMIAFLGASCALLLIGSFMLIDAVLKLIRAEHPTIGAVEIFGRQVWLGWVMIAALLYSVVPPVILGRLKGKPARELHEKTLHVDAATNAADWKTAIAAIVGILGIGLGLWWADAAAAAVIAADIVHDGVKNISRAVGDLIDNRPTTVEKAEPDPIVDTLRQALLTLPWVRLADLRLRDEGHVVAGEAYVVPVSEERLIERLEEAGRALREAHWRVCDVEVVPLSEDVFRRRSVEEEPSTAGGDASISPTPRAPA